MNSTWESQKSQEEGPLLRALLKPPLPALQEKGQTMPWYWDCMQQRQPLRLHRTFENRYPLIEKRYLKLLANILR